MTAEFRRITHCAVIVAVMMICGVSCSHEHKAPTAKLPNYTEQDLKEHLTEGVTPQQVTALFGAPFTERTLDNGERMLQYQIPPYEDARDGLRGFRAFFKDDALTRWVPIKSSAGLYP